MKFLTRYSLDRPKVLARKGKGSKTKQSFVAECDLNNILAKFNKTGRLPEMIQREPRYGDFSDPQDFMESMNVVALANEQFAALPAHVRSRFANDPAAFLDFASDSSNAAEMIKLGLATARWENDPNAPPSPPEAPKNEIKKGATPPKVSNKQTDDS